MDENMEKEILVVDDSTTTLVLLEYFLQENGYNSFLASDVEEAIEYLKNKKPNLIILDIQLPKITGYEFLRILKRENNTIPVIMISAIDTSESKILVKDLGAIGYITKPFKLDELLNKIVEFIN
jgi:two-component system, OmpR family, alkaline phosphatase synthesis response regulator PhoP